ncbi:MAG: hypothetical protein QM831_33965 [Kofleriaceae bacterium]
MKWLVLIFGAACSSTSSTTPPKADDAKKPVVVPAVPPGPYRVDAKAPHGDVQIRVEWKDVPTVARSSPGRTACGTAKSASVAPTVTWGIPDVLVMIEVDHGKEIAWQPSRVVLEKCGLSPRLSIGSAAWIASAMEGPVDVSLSTVGTARPLEASDIKQPHVIHLPVIGREVDAGGSDLVSIVSADDSALVAIAPTPYYAVTEANGQVVLRDVPVGTFEVRALLPARSGQPAKKAKGTVTVAANALAEVTLSLE